MIKIGIICPSEIAFRRFLPALKKTDVFQFVGVAIANEDEWFGERKDGFSSDITGAVLKSEKEKANKFIELYGGKIFNSYTSLVHSVEIDAIYLPLPPALHYYWAKHALEAGKHIFLEKPFTTSFTDTSELISIAEKNNLAVHENYMFVFHNQIFEIKKIVDGGEIGDVRLYRISFGFPRRAADDFRYNKKLGGGALLDCGGYTIKLASLLLGDSARVVCAFSNYIDGFAVDMYGSGTMVNDEGLSAQISFGMDNSYKCELELWGSKGCLTTGRVLTIPDGCIPEVTINVGNEIRTKQLSADDAFMKSINKFQECIKNDCVRIINYKVILKQSKLVDDFMHEQKGTKK